MSFLALDGLTGHSYEGGVVQRRGYTILSRSESLDDESDRISFCQVFRDLVVSNQGRSTELPYFSMQNSCTNQKCST